MKRNIMKSLNLFLNNSLPNLLTFKGKKCFLHNSVSVLNYACQHLLDLPVIRHHLFANMFADIFMAVMVNAIIIINFPLECNITRLLGYVGSALYYQIIT